MYCGGVKGNPDAGHRYPRRLTAEIHEATFGLKPGDHKELKGIARENLRDHMTNRFVIPAHVSAEALAKEEACVGMTKVSAGDDTKDNVNILLFFRFFAILWLFKFA